MELVCVFAASSVKVEQKYLALARELGQSLARSGRGLVFGAGSMGLMGQCAQGVMEQGGRVVGVLPEKLHLPGVAFPGCHELIVTKTMHERKAKMEELASGFIALPGGLGTLEELLETLVLKQLGYHSLPIVILNQDGYYDSLIGQIERCIAGRFTDEAFRGLYYSADSVEAAMEYLAAYRPEPMPDKMEDFLQ